MVDKNLEMQLRERQSKLKRVSKHLKSNTHTYMHRKKKQSQNKRQQKFEQSLSRIEFAIFWFQQNFYSFVPSVSLNVDFVIGIALITAFISIFFSFEFYALLCDCCYYYRICFASFCYHTYIFVDLKYVFFLGWHFALIVTIMWQ